MSKLPDWEKKHKRCQSGDLCAYDQLMQRYEKGICLCYRMSGARMIRPGTKHFKAFRALPMFKGQASFSTGCIRIAVNTCLMVAMAKNAGSLSPDQALKTKTVTAATVS